MKIPTAHFLVMLFLPSAFGEFCFRESDRTDACNTTSSRNLTRNPGDDHEPLVLEDASASREDFKLHEDVSLCCEYYAFPYCPTIRWFKDGKELLTETGKRIITEGGRTLRIFSSKDIDRGNYTCIATTPFNETYSHDIELFLTLKCKGEIHVEPASNVVREVKIGSNPNVVCKFFCYGDGFTLDLVTWVLHLDGKGSEEPLFNGSNYRIHKYKRYKNRNGPSVEQKLTVLNFTKDQNISCTFNRDKRLAIRTFHLVVKECDEEPHITPKRVQEIVVAKGSNKTLQCHIFCLKVPDFDKPVWRNGIGEEITSSSQKYELSRNKLDNRKNPFTLPNYEISLTVIDISRSENFSCYLSPKASTTFKLSLTPECDEEPHITPKRVQEIVVAKGSNKTLQCHIFCLKVPDFDKPVWRNGIGEEITSSSQKYELSRNKLDNRKSPFTLPNYEISLTVIDISRSENFSCYLSPKASTTFKLSVTPASNKQKSEQSFFTQRGVWIVIGVMLLTLLVVIFLAVWFRRRLINKWRVFYRPNKKEEAAKYDVFVSFCQADGGSFVTSCLQPMLRDECGYKLALHYDAFTPGDAIVNNIDKCIYDSRRILTVITRKFLNSEWCKYEVDQSLRRAVEKPNVLVVIMLNEIPFKELPKSLCRYLNKVTYLPWNESERNKMREKLKRALGSPLTIEDERKETFDNEHARADKLVLDEVTVQNS